MSNIRLSIVIPCYNESKNLPLLIDRINKSFINTSTEVILVDNGSTDKSSELIYKLLKGNNICRSIRIEKNIGYGYGILKGLESSKGKILSWTHADMQTDPKDCLKGLKLFDLYGENIFVKGIRKGRSNRDNFFTVGMSFFEAIILGKFMWDINAQPTMFSSTTFKKWLNPPDDFALDLYAYYFALKNKIKIYKFPVKFDKRAYGISHWNINFKSKLSFIKRTIKYSLNLKKNF